MEEVDILVGRMDEVNLFHEPDVDVVSWSSDLWTRSTSCTATRRRSTSSSWTWTRSISSTDLTRTHGRPRRRGHPRSTFRRVHRRRDDGAKRSAPRPPPTPIDAGRQPPGVARANEGGAAARRTQRPRPRGGQGTPPPTKPRPRPLGRGALVIGRTPPLPTRRCVAAHHETRRAAGGGRWGGRRHNRTSGGAAP